MNHLIELQHWLYGGMWRGMTSTTDIAAVPAFMAGAFVFGMVHALMPGHGKSVLVSYHLGRPSRVLDGALTGTLLALTHVGIAVLFVMAGVAVISRSLALAGRAPAFEATSAALIAAVGAFLLYRAMQPGRHIHSSDGKALAFFAGLVPCPLTTFILVYALSHNQLALGFAAVLAMLGGVIVTIVSFAVAAVLVRDRFVRVLDKSEGLRERLGFWLECAGGVAVLALGLSMFFSAVKWL